MNTPLIRFPSIKQFRDIYHDIKWNAQHVGWDEQGKEICNLEASLPTVLLYGTVKLHGQNIGVNVNSENIWYQTRERVIDEGSEYLFLKKREEVLLTLSKDVAEKYKINLNEYTITLYFEFAGKGIQRSTAIQEFDKALYLIAVHYAKTDELTILDENGKHKKTKIQPITLNSILTPQDQQIYNIHKFKTFHLIMDLNDIESAKNILEKLTLEVENNCPVAESLRNTITPYGNNTIGEGIVWYLKVGILSKNAKFYTFKTKGEKYKIATHEKPVSVPIDGEKLASIEEFAKYAVTPDRVLQAIQTHCPLDNVGTPKVSMKDLNLIIQWVVKDIKKEEQLSLQASNLEMKDVSKAIVILIKKEFNKYLTY